MNTKFHLLIFFCISTGTSLSQNTKTESLLNMGDAAPPLRVDKWLKGMPFNSFEKGSVYVVEFWATWCQPCKAAMPHLSALSRQYGDKLKILGIDVYEKNNDLKKVKSFVDSMGDRMDYNVATDKDLFMQTFWVKATGNEGIPKTIIVNRYGKIAWIGHPKDLEKVVPKILDNTWDIAEALANRNLNKYLEAIDDSLVDKVRKFRGNYDFISPGIVLDEPKNTGHPDSILYYINKTVKAEPRLKYQPTTAYFTMYALLKLNQYEAYEFGKKALVSSVNTESPSRSIRDVINLLSSEISFFPEIYELGAEAYQAVINEVVYPELINIPNHYHKMAWWYWLAKNKSKAIEAEQQAISTLESRNLTFVSELNIYKAQLESYKTCSVEN